MPVITRQGVPAIALVDRVPTPDRVIVQIQKFRDQLTGLAVIQKQHRVRSPGNAVIFTLATHTSLKGATICLGQKTGTYHGPT